MKWPARTRHRKKRWGIVLALVVLMGGLAAAVYPREPLLLEHATRVLDMHATDPSEGLNYAWLSNHELLYFRPDGNLWRRDLNTGAETVLRALTQQVKSSISLPATHWLMPSPDGKWLMWGEVGITPLFVGSVDGTRRAVSSTNVGNSTPFWMPDSQHWTEWNHDESALWRQVEMHTVTAPHWSQILGTPPARLNESDILAMQFEDVIIARTKVDVIAVPVSVRQGYYRLTLHAAYRDTQQLSVWSLHAQKPLRQFTIHLPGPALYVKVSPQGDRVAWLVQRQNTSSVFERLQRMISAWKGGEHESLAVYVSQLDGSHLHEIGRLDSNVKPTDNLLEKMQWLPGGKRLSFIANDALWTVMVE